MNSLREKRIPVLVAITFIVVAVLAVFSVTSFQRLLQTSRLLSITNRIVNYSEAVLKSYTLMESSQRAFIITGNEEFLELLEEGHKTMALRLHLLDSLTHEQPLRHERIQTLKSLTDRGEEWLQLLGITRRKSFDEAQALVISGRGKQLYDSIAMVVNEIQQEARQQFLNQNTITNQSLKNFQYSFIGLAIAITTVISLLFYTVNRALKERKRIEHELIAAAHVVKEREERFRSIITSVADAIIVLDEHGLIRNWNKGAELIFGWTEEEVLGNPMTMVMPEKYRDLHTQGMTRFKQSGESTLIGKTIELEGLRRNGEIFPVELSISTWQTEGHTFFGGILRDITERKQTQKQIAELASIVESTDEAIIAINTDGIIQNWNKGAEQIYGYTRDEAQGKHINLIIPESLHDEEKTFIQQAVRGISSKHFETKRIRKDGTQVDISLTISPIMDKASGMIGISKISRDITAIKQRENKIVQLNKELDAFTYSVSHDLRAPLRHISGYSQILLEDYSEKLDDEGKRVTQVIIRNTNRMGQLIDDLLNFARMNRKELTMSQLNMMQLVTTVLQDFTEFEARSEVTFGELLPVNGDHSMMNQVWINLISNAFKYSSKKDQIRLEIGSYRQDQEICYFVKDNGVGFNMEYKHKLFGVFQRLHKADEFEGTGVGLALVKRIIQRHGGRVWAEGEVNQGAVFYFSLPAVLRSPHED